MTGVHPIESKENSLPTYEQVVQGPQVPQMSNSIPTYPTSNIAYPIQTPPIGVCPTSMMMVSSNTQAFGTGMLINTRSLMYGDVPVQCVCPNCYQAICTRIEKRTGILPWIICCGILMMGGWLGCCVIPFCIDSLQDTEHYCPHCAALLGKRRRI